MIAQPTIRLRLYRLLMMKELNALKSEQIHEGQHLMVVYYDTELR